MSKSNISFTNDGNDSNDRVGTSVLVSSINENNVNLPTISPVQTELRRAEKRVMAINSPFATFVDHVTSLVDFKRNYEDHQTEYENFASKYANKIVNYSLDLSPKHSLDNEAVGLIREIQFYADSPFLFEYESDMNQSVDSLNNQLIETQDWLDENNSTKILVPVLDMKITKEHLLSDKLEALSDKYNRINVIYASPLKKQANWADLKAFLKDSNIWCHMDCVLNRYDSDRIAHRVRLYAIGILSTSLGFPFGGNGSNKKRIYGFRSESHTFELLKSPHTPSFAEKKDRTWITSLNDEIKELQIMREHTRNGTLYTEYLPSKDGSYLAFSERI
jgi:hypothetical protein